MTAGDTAPARDAAQITTRSRRPWVRHPGLFGGMALALLDLAVYLAYALTARPAPCSTPQITTPVLDCFWPTLGASLATLPWVYVGLTLAAPLVVTLVAAAGDASAASAARGATIGGAVGLLGSLFEVLIVVGVLIYQITVAPTPQATPGCLEAPPPCATGHGIPISSIPGLAELFLLVAATFAGIILLLRLTAGAGLGALGGWLGQRLTPPTPP